MMGSEIQISAAFSPKGDKKKYLVKTQQSAPSWAHTTTNKYDGHTGL
jgi:hypothetical protein